MSTSVASGVVRQLEVDIRQEKEENKILVFQKPKETLKLEPQSSTCDEKTLGTKIVSHDESKV